jgi:hypothetical protein
MSQLVPKTAILFETRLQVLQDINPRMPLKLVIEEAHDDFLHDLESHGGGRKDEHMYGESVTLRRWCAICA